MQALPAKTPLFVKMDIEGHEVDALTADVWRAQALLLALHPPFWRQRFADMRAPLERLRDVVYADAHVTCQTFDQAPAGITHKETFVSALMEPGVGFVDILCTRAVPPLHDREL